jgi:hypothetical protein
MNRAAHLRDVVTLTHLIDTPDGIAAADSKLRQRLNEGFEVLGFGLMTVDIDSQSVRNERQVTLVRRR